MKGFVYLIRNGDLYKIGSAKNLDQRINQLKPDEIIQTINTNNFKALEARLLRRYKNKRIPESGYFRLDDSEILDCKRQMGPNSIIPNGLDDEFKIAISASILFLIITFVFSWLFELNLLKALSISIAFSSVPMFVLSLLGNFGGYYSKDLALFTTWNNRLKGLLMAILILSASFTCFQLTKFIN